MLTATMAALSVLAAAAPAHAAAAVPAADAAGELVEPERLTAGSADQFLAVLDPAAERLIYVSNENATTELFGVDLSVRSPRRLFDEAADVTWPRVSPDGSKLLYLAFRSAATGELCVRDLRPGSLEVSERRCLSLGGRTAMHALWEPSGKTVLVVSRQGLGGEIDLRRFAVAAAGENGAAEAGEVLLTRALSSPALSADGRYLLYVQVTRQAAEVSGRPVATPRAAAPEPKPGALSRSLQLVRLDAPGAEPRAVTFELPGFPGFPAFTPDDKFVYFVQYLDDTNHDGLVDANDRGALFRAPFDAQAGAVDSAHVEQLTAAEWNCQYPFPGKDRLVATCLGGGSLDVFTVPLAGALPASWTAARVQAELAEGPPRDEEMLLRARALELATAPRDRALELQRSIEACLNAGETQSADFYARALSRLGATEPAPEGAEDAGLAQVLTELAGHLRASANLGVGQSTSAFNAEARARLLRLEPLRAAKNPAVAALAALVQSEVEGALGDKGRELLLLGEVRAAVQSGPASPLVLHRLALRAGETYDSLGLRDELLATLRLVAGHPSLAEAERLAQSEALLHVLLRGRGEAERRELLAQEARLHAPDSAAAFAVAVERALQGLDKDTQGEAESRVFALLTETSVPARRRALMLQAIARAESHGCETLWYDLAERWAQAAGAQGGGRARAERLFAQVGLERAYAEWAAGKLAEARAHFEAVTRQTSSWEAWAGDIDVALQAGQSAEQLEAAFRARFQGAPDAPALQFALAQLQARGLPAESDAQTLSRRAEAAKQHLRAPLRTTPNSVAIHYLWAWLRHQEYLRTGDKETASRANAHYQIALDLARAEPRYLAATLSGLGFLHGKLGNHSMAAGYLEEREKLPFAGPLPALAVCLSHARSLLHSEHEPEAAALSDRCVALADGAPALSRFVPYALDHSALYHLDAGEPQRALARYDRLGALMDQVQPMQQPQPGADELAGRRNRFVVALGRASAQISLNQPREALAELAVAEQLFRLPGGISLLQPTYPRKSSSGAFTQAGMAEDDEVLLTGLRARALTLLGDHAAAEVQSQRRLALLQARLARDGDSEAGDDDRKVFGLVEANLAVDRYRAGDLPGAIAQVEAGLRAADALAERTATPIHGVALTLLREYADLHFEGKAPLAQLKLDLPGRLAKLYGELIDHPQPRWLAMRDLYRLYLQRLMLEGVPVKL